MLYHETYLSKSPNAEWLFLIHGAGGSTRTWKRQIDDLSRAHHLVVIDLPGHGQSAAVGASMQSYSFESVCAKMWEVVDFLKIESVHLVGVSLGAILAMQMEAMRPQQVKSMVMAGAIVQLNTKLKVVASVSLALSKIIGFRAFYAFASRVILPKRNHQKSRQIFMRESQALSIEEFKKWTALYGPHLNQTLERLHARLTEIPKLLVMGDQDHLFLQPAKVFARFQKNAQLKIIEKCGHVVSIEKARQFNEACLEFLGKYKLFSNPEELRAS